MTGTQYSLLEYLVSRFPQLSESILLQKCDLDSNHSQYEQFLKQTVIVALPTRPQILFQLEYDELAYSEFVEYLVHQLDSRTFTSTVPKGLRNIDLRSNYLKSTLWEKLCSRVGRRVFATLVLEALSLSLHDGSSISLRMQSWQPTNLPGTRVALRKMTMYYRKQKNASHRQLDLEDSASMICQIYNLNKSSRQLPRRFRKLKKQLEIAQKNEVGLRYRSIWNNVVSRKPLTTKVFDNATSFKQVLKFILIVIWRTFPSSMFGCSSNRVQITNCIVSTLKTPRNTSLDLNRLVGSLKLTSIEWLGKTPTITSQQDYQSRRQMLSGFVAWFFAKYLTKLTASFWYVTENFDPSTASAASNLFFDQKNWENLTRPWLESYVDKHLACSIKAESISNESEFNYGVLRLLPKKADFRPLCIPLKSRHGNRPSDPQTKQQSRRAYNYFNYNVIRPVREILRYQLRKYFLHSLAFESHCFSVNDVFEKVARFKAELNTKFGGKLPQLHAVIFDMKHCFDNLNQSMILSCIERLFSMDSSSEEYIVKTYYVSNSARQNRRMKSLVVSSEDVQFIDVFSYNPCHGNEAVVLGDDRRSCKFTKSDIADLVRSQVLDSSIEIPDLGRKIYQRTEGVFQGLPLSGSLSEIVYDFLINDLIEPKLPKDQIGSLFRLADDFLFISTKQDTCKSVLQLVTSSEAQKYGAYVNGEKMKWTSAESPTNSKVQFLGLVIDLGTLDIERPENSYIKLTSKISKSFEATLSYLSWRFTHKIADCLLDLQSSKFEVVSSNVLHILIPTIECAIAKLKSDSSAIDKTEKFEVFVLQLIHRILDRFNIINNCSDLSPTLFIQIWTAVEKLISRRGMSTTNMNHLVFA